MNDSGWYYMNVHFVNTGEYITESRYPSFDHPSQYYPFFGYSFFLFVCNKIALSLGVGVAFIIKYGQFIMYLFSGILVKNIIFQLTNREKLAYAIGACFLLYYPYFNYVNLVMSETYATFLILLTCYLFIRTQVRFSKATIAILFLIAGYIILIKPVFLPISIAITVLYSISVVSSRKYSLLFFVSFILVFPVTQSIFSKVHYDNYKLQSGLGWHMWDRVICYDKQIPHSSENLDQLKEIYKNENKPVSYGFWWDVTKDLSEFGYKEPEIQKMCQSIAFDAIAEEPVTYILKTFENSYTSYIDHNTEERVYSNTSEYIDEINKFSKEQQHKPLTDELDLQTYYSSFYLNDKILSFNVKYAEFSNIFNYLIHNSVLLFLFVLAGIHSIYILLKSRFEKNRIEFLLWFTAFSIIFGSNLAEYPQSRLVQPAVIFVIIVITLKINHLRLHLKRRY
jgi:hypothetical protein